VRSKKCTSTNKKNQNKLLAAIKVHTSSEQQTPCAANLENADHAFGSFIDQRITMAVPSAFKGPVASARVGATNICAICGVAREKNHLKSDEHTFAVLYKKFAR